MKGRGFGRRRTSGQRQLEPEAAAFPGYAVRPKLALHQLHQTAGNRESETGAAESARVRAVRLGEGIENRLQLVRRDTDSAVPDVESHHSLARKGNGDAHKTRSRELHRIAHQIQEDLAQPDRIAPNPAR